MTEGALYVFYQMVDLFWAGQGFGLGALAGVGAVWSYTNLALTARGGLDTAMRAMVSRAVGAGDMAQANRVVLQAFGLNVLISVIAILPGVLFPSQLLGLLGVPSQVQAEVELYMRFQFVNQALVAWRTRNVRPIPSRRLRSAAASRTKVISPAPSKPSTATHQRRRASSPGWAHLRLSIDRSDPCVPSNA